MSVTGSEDCGGTQTVEDLPPLQMSEIYYLLLAELSEAEQSVEDAKSHANENQPRQSWGALLRNQKKVHNSQIDVQSVFKKRIMEGLSRSVEDMAPLGEPLQSGHASLELRSKLLERVKKDRENIEHMTSQLAQLQGANKDLEQTMEELEKIVTSRTMSGEMKTNLQLEEIGKRVKQHRAKTVRDVRYVTEELCGTDSDAQQILSDAFKATQLGNDPYISVEGADIEDVEFLLRCNLITRNPHDPSLVRLRDLV